MTMDAVASKIRGPKGTDVKITVKRFNTAKPLEFVIERGDIPVTSVDAKFMLNDSVGYVKVGKFARNTYPEFLQAIGDLRYHGATNLIIDLRGNTGGYMEPAIFTANEFLASGLNIVETRGRKPSDNSMVLADGTGAFSDMGLVVLVDEFTASSSEIFSRSSSRTTTAVSSSDAALSAKVLSSDPFCCPTRVRSASPSSGITPRRDAASRKTSSAATSTHTRARLSNAITVARYSAPTA